MNKADVYILSKNMAALLGMYAMTEPGEACRERLESEIEETREKLRKALDGDNQ